MKLGTKIGMGFGALIAIALLLGGMAVVIMGQVKKIAQELAHENVPEVKVAVSMERAALNTMYQARGYVYTEEKPFFEGARKSLEEVKNSLAEAKAHADRYELATLRDNTAKAETEALTYEKLLGQTVEATDAMGREKAASLAAAGNYMKICNAFLDDESNTLSEDIKDLLKAKTGSGATSSTADLQRLFEERIRKVALCNEIITLGNDIRIGTWQAIASRDLNLFQETEKKFENVNNHLDELKACTKQERHLKLIADCRQAGKDYLGCMERFLSHWNKREELNKVRGQSVEQMLKAAQDTAEMGLQSTDSAADKAASSLGMASKIMIGGLGGGILVGLSLAILITLSITRPVRRVIAGLTSGAEQTAAAAGQVAQSSQSMASGASEQASSLEETSASLEEITSMTKQNEDHARHAIDLMGQAQAVIGGMSQAMEEMSGAITEIKSSADQTAKIIKTIDEIAFQTNLLALNAAVEAARAGEAGKGFAVVAEEVRNLAQRSAEAAKNTAAMIEGSVKSADNGVQVTRRVADALQKTVENAGRVSELINEIAAASKEQAQGIEQVNTAVAQMDQVTQQNAANSEESASAAEELSAQAEEMRRIVNELVTMVSGKAAPGAGGQSGAHSTHDVQKLTHQPNRMSLRPVGVDVSIRKAPALAQPCGARQHSPSVAIPLEDDELASFR